MARWLSSSFEDEFRVRATSVNFASNWLLSRAAWVFKVYEVLTIICLKLASEDVPKSIQKNIVRGVNEAPG